MKISDIPANKFPIPFANSAGGGYIRTIPEASQIGITNGAASLTDGFPPQTFLPVGAGGTPPWGQDFNGLLKQITQWVQWQNAGGFVNYDSAFSTSIGGYPKGAVLASTTAGVLWLNIVDDNTTNPDSGGTNWKKIALVGTSVVSTAGYIDLPGGVTLQWGTSTTSSGSVTITFPKAFAAVPYTIIGIDNGANGWSTSNASFLGTATKTATQCTFRSVTWNGTGMILTATSFAYLAVGPT